MTEKIDKYIINNLIQAERDGFKIIIMGDFNVDPDQFHASLLNNRKPHWKFNLIRKLEELRFIDCYSLFHEDIRPTWISPNNRSSSSRIDLIWLSESLHYDILYSDHHFNHIYNTDHKTVFVHLLNEDIFDRFQYAHTKRSHSVRQTFNYKSVTGKDWEKFSHATSHFFEHSRLKDINFQQPTITLLNDAWSLIRQGIMSAAKTHIPSTRISGNIRDLRPDSLIILHKHLRSISSLIMKFRPKHIRNSTYPSAKDWSDIYFPMLISIAKHIGYTFPKPYLSKVLTIDNVSIVQHHITDIFKSLYAAVRLEEVKYRNDSIKHYVTKRCDNYIDN